MRKTILLFMALLIGIAAWSAESTPDTRTFLKGHVQDNDRIALPGASEIIPVKQSDAPSVYCLSTQYGVSRI